MQKSPFKHKVVGEPELPSSDDQLDLRKEITLEHKLRLLRILVWLAIALLLLQGFWIWKLYGFPQGKRVINFISQEVGFSSSSESEPRPKVESISVQIPTTLEVDWFESWKPAEQADIRAGILKSEPFVGYTLLMRKIENGYLYFAQDLSSEGEPVDLTNFEIDGITNLPQTVRAADLNLLLKVKESAKPFNPDDISKVLFIDKDLGPIMLTKTDCIVAKLPNLLIVNLELDTGFTDPKTGRFDAIWQNENYNLDKYFSVSTTSCALECNSPNILAHATSTDPTWEKIGTTGTGDPLFSLKDPQSKIFKNLYNSLSAKDKLSYSAFVETHPIVFWRDGLGRWIEFTNSKFSDKTTCLGN